MEYLGMGEIFVFFIGPLIAPVLALIWFLSSRKKAR